MEVLLSKGIYIISGIICNIVGVGWLVKYLVRRYVAENDKKIGLLFGYKDDIMIELKKVDVLKNDIEWVKRVINKIESKMEKIGE